MLYGQTHVPSEFMLRATRGYEDIFNEIDVDVTFVAPDGGEWNVPAFWAGGNVFGVRFTAPGPGRYTYRTTCTNPDDPGLHGQEGELEIIPYEGDCYLYQRGRLGVAANRRTLEQADGTPFLWMGDTWWFGLVERLDWPHGFRRLTADRVAKGFNVIQIVAGPLPDFDAVDNPFDPQQRNEAGLSWEEGWTRINPGFYDLADLRIAHLVECGLMPCIVGMWGYFLPVMGVEKVKKHWRNLAARYGAYPVVWCMAGEVNMPTYSTTLRKDEKSRLAERRALEEGWTEVTQYLRGLDPYHNLITAHPYRPDSRSALRDESLLDLDMLQTGHFGYASLGPSLEILAECLAKTPRMPTFNSEVNYEGIMAGSGAEVQRFLFWTSITAGACGFTYGAQGIWAMNAPQDPHVGYTGSWGDGYWQEAMHRPGSAHVALGRRLVERYPWWLFEPRVEPQAEERGRTSAFAAGIAGKVALFYSPPNGMPDELSGMRGDWSGALLDIAIEPGAKYRAFYFNPCTGQEVRSYKVRGNIQVDMGPVAPRPDGFWTPPRKPTMEDWVLVLEDAEALGA